VDGQILNKITNKVLSIEAHPNQRLQEILNKIPIPH
jgi:hypothetical protein